jgi:hypothetical protein
LRAYDSAPGAIDRFSADRRRSISELSPVDEDVMFIVLEIHQFRQMVGRVGIRDGGWHAPCGW